MSQLLIGIDAINFLERQGFSVLKSCLVRNPGEAARAAAAIGFPVTLKISSEQTLHKTEAGGVITGLDNESSATEAYTHIMSNFKARHPELEPDGVVVQKQGHGFELIVGTITDPQFGPVIMFGLGGIFAEAVRDVSFRLIPIGRRDAVTMMEELRGYEAIRKPRKGSINLHAVRDFLVDISDCIVNHPQIREMDLNPVFASTHGVEICDARIRID